MVNADQQVTLSDAPTLLHNVNVVDGVAEALMLATEMSLSTDVLRLAEEAARVLRADLVGIQILAYRFQCTVGRIAREMERLP